MSEIAGYNGFAQPLIQERAARQTAANSDDSTQSSAKPNASREALFRSLLKANESSTESTNVSSGSGTVRADASQGRGQFLDVLV